MASLQDQLSALVYSTESGDMCPGCRKPKADCVCDELADQERLSSLDGIVRIHRESKGRGGKAVSLVKGVALPEKELKALAKSLKKMCGCGGALKDGVIEIQGDKRDQLKAELEKRGFKVKLAGG
ncbi:MAG: translation initiation factor Sui1 [Pontibacterium sp.]